jgi:hypothetical protein
MSLLTLVRVAGLMMVSGDVADGVAPAEAQGASTACVLAMSHQACSEAIAACQRATQLAPQHRVSARLLRLARETQAAPLAQP